MDEYGYTMIANALTPAQIDAMNARLVEQATCEAALTGKPITRDDPQATGFVQSLHNKGRIWHTLLDPASTVHTVMAHVFTPSFDPFMSQFGGLQQTFLLSSMGAKFKHLEYPSYDGQPLRHDFHTDQKWANGHQEYALVATVFYMLTDFTYENGCTMVVPGSHKIPSPAYGVIRHDQPLVDGKPVVDYQRYADVEPERISRAVPAEAPAGTAFIFDGRLWHAAGINTNGARRAHVNGFYCAPYIRQRELYSMNLRQDVVDQLSDEQLMILGFDTMLQRVGDGLFNRIEPTLGRTNITNKLESIGELSLSDGA